MEKLNIDFRSIRVQAQELSAHLDDAFFQALDQDEICGGNLNAQLTVRSNAGEIFHTTIQVKGDVVVECDRCLAPLTIPVDCEETLKIKVGEDEMGNDDLVYLPYEASGMYDLSWLVYETIEVNLPIQRCHEDGACDEEMIEKLKSYQTVVDTDDEN